MEYGKSPSAQPPRRLGYFGEARALLRLGLPIVGTQLFIMGTGFVDTLMAGRYGARDLAGVALGGTVLWPVFMFMTGVTMAVTPMVSQLLGAKRVHQSGEVIRHGVWIALFAALATMAVMRNVAPLFALMDVDLAAAEVAVGYLQAASWGLPAAMAYIALRQAAEGLGQTRPPMLIAGLALLLNAPLNYLLIYGALGFPELGGVGCGWATAAVMWFELGLMLLVTRRPFFRATRLFKGGLGFGWGMTWRIFKLGLPIGATIFLEMAVYSVVGILIARLGVNEMAGHSIAGNLNWMTYVIPMSLGSAAAIRVGLHVGAQDLKGARRSANTAFGVSLAYALLVSVALIGLRFHLAGVYTTDVEVVRLAANLVVFIAIYQIFDDANATLAGALRGYKDTRAPMVFSLVGYWAIALPMGEALAGGWGGLPATGVYGYWAGMTIGLLLVSLCMAVRLRRTSHDVVRIGRLAQG